MGTGTAVSTGDIITAAKMNLKLEDARDMANLGITDGGGANEVILAVSETNTSDRTLTLALNNASRSLSLSGNVSLAGDITTAAAVTQAGAFALTLTTTATTNATLPEGTVTLADLGTAQTVTGAKTFNSSALLLNNPAGTNAYTFAGAAIAAGRTITLPLLIGADTMVTADFIQTLTNKSLTAPAITGGTAIELTGFSLRSTGGNDLVIATTAAYGADRTLTINIPVGSNAALTLTGDLIRVGAHSLTLTTSGTTDATIPAGTVTLVDLGTTQILTAAKTFTSALTIDGNVDTVFNPTTSPIFDIGADIFETGTFIDIAYDTAETLTAALIGINLDFNTNVTLSGQNITGIDVTLPATYGAGTEYGIRVRGDGQTITVSNDADLYLSLAKANSVDINIQGVSPVVDIGADVLEGGYFVSVDYDTAEATTTNLYILDVFRTANALTLGADLYGINLDFNTNVTAAHDRDVIGYRIVTPALTSAGATTTNYYGFTLPTAGALVMNNAGGGLNFYGINVQMPNITQTAGTMLAVGVQLTEGTTTSGTCNAININGDVDTVINFSASPIVDIGADVFSIGTAIYFSWDTAETATGALVGSHMDMNTNLTPLGGQNVTAYTGQTPAFTNAAAAATVLTGYQLPTVGALVMNNAGGSLVWYGLDIQMPNITQTAGAMTAMGIRLTEGVSTSGTINAININGSVDTIVNFSASPVVDVGADAFSTGYFMDIGFDTIETLTAQLTGIRIDWDAVVVTTGGAGTGNITPFWADLGNLAVNAAYNGTIYGIRLDLDFTVGGAETIYGASIVMPAAYGLGTEIGIHYTGDGQTINIGNDADLYASFAKANSVDVNLRGISPVVDIGADVLEGGYIISVDYDTAEATTADLYILDVFRAANALTLGGDLYGVNLDFNTNVTAAADRDVIGYRLTSPALTSAGAVATVFTGFSLPTAGALVMNNAGGSLTWYGANIQLPNITQTAGTMTAIGIQLTEGVTTSGTSNAININGDVDTIVNFSASPIVDIGADIFNTGTFVDVAYDTAEIAVGAITGVNVNLNTNLTPVGGQNIVGLTTQTAAFTNVAAAATVLTGYQLPTAGALVMNNAGGALTWYGVDLQLPNVTQTAGAMIAYGLRIVEGVTASGTAAGIYCDVDLAIDLVTLGNRIDLDADNDTSIRAAADDVITFEMAAGDHIVFDGVNAVIDIAAGGTAFRVDLDVDNDTSIRTSADDIIDIEIAGADLIRMNLDTGAATGVIRAASATEIGISVSNQAFTVGAAGTLLIPQQAAAGSDAAFGDADGCFGYDNAGNTLEVRDAGAWLSSGALAGYVIQSYAPRTATGGWYHPNQFWGVQNTNGVAMVNETICPVCGDPITPCNGHVGAVVFYPNAYMEKAHEGKPNVHAIFGHLECDPVVQKLLKVVDVLARKCGYTSAEEALNT